MDEKERNHGNDFTAKLGKEVDHYGDANNYTAPGELTVTITLNEYRDLVTAKAEKDNLNWWKRYTEEQEKRKAAEAKLAELKDRIAREVVE